MKTNTRKRLALIRNSISYKERLKLSNLIKKNLFSITEYKNAKSILFYSSFGSEVITTQMIKKSVEKKTTLLPVVLPEKKTIIACEVKDLENDLHLGFSKIVEPKSYCKKYQKSEIDLVVVPGIAFGEQGERLGYGGGFYDRFLEGFTGKIIGICFENQITDKIVLENHDVKMHKIITEKRVIDCYI